MKVLCVLFILFVLSSLAGILFSSSGILIYFPSLFFYLVDLPVLSECSTLGFYSCNSMVVSQARSDNPDIINFSGAFSVSVISVLVNVMCILLSLIMYCTS